jgi:DNA adenine methylase
MLTTETARGATRQRLSPGRNAPPKKDGPRPPLKWAGGKRWLVPRLRELWDAHRQRRLVEPLCGGLAVSLGLMPAQALLNDINPHSINFYGWLKRGLTLTTRMRNGRRCYDAHRARFNDLVLSGRSGSAEAAELFYYLNRTGYNGLCRFNRKGLFNVPFGRYKTINYARTDDLIEYAAVFRDWTFTCGPFEAVPLAPDDFVYADPPYDVEFRQYSAEGFSWDDQRRLAMWLAKHPGPVVLSNQATDRIMDLYEELGFSLERLKGPRRISCTGDRTPAWEVLATHGL